MGTICSEKKDKIKINNSRRIDNQEDSENGQNDEDKETGKSNHEESISDKKSEKNQDFEKKKSQNKSNNNRKIIKSIQNDDWDYKNHGTDWAATFSNCGKGQQAPGKVLSSQAENLEKSNFFYANLNVKKGTIKNSTLELIENNNILSLSSKI